MKFNALFNNFSSGEWSEKLVGRSDSEEFDNASLLMQNFIPKLSGGAFKRNGTSRLKLTGALQILLDPANGPYKMIPWKTSIGNFILLIGTGAANAGGWLVVIPGFGGADTEHRIFSGGTAAAFATLSPASIQYAQVGDALVLTTATQTVVAFVGSPVGPSFSLSYWEDAAVQLGRLKIAEAYPYRPLVALGSGGPVLSTSGTTGSITVTSAAPYFNAFHVGTIFKFTSGASTGVARITAFSSTTSVGMTVIETLPLSGAYGSAAGTAWEEAAWNNFRGWPKAITLFQQRLIFANNDENDDHIWGSRIGAFFRMMERPYAQDPAFSTFTTDNSRPFTLLAAGPTGTAVTALSANEDLEVGYDSQDAVLSGTQGALGANDSRFSIVSGLGTAPVQPAQVGGASIFATSTGDGIKEIVFDDTVKKFRANNLSFVNDLILRSITRIVPSNFSKQPSAWFPDLDYTPVLNIDKQYKQNSWWRFVTQGTVLDCCYINTGNFGDYFFLLVQRNGFLEIERFYQDSQETYTGPTTTHDEGCFLDCAQTHSGSLSGGTFTITGLSRLNTKTVTVIMPDTGRKIGTFTVASNQITFASSLVPSPVNGMDFVLGYSYDAVLRTYPIEIGNQIQNSAQGRIKKVDEIVLKLWKSVGVQYGKSLDQMFEVPSLPYASTPIASPYPLTTETTTVYLDKGYDRQFSVYLRHVEPYPCNVLALIARGQTND